MGDHHGAPPQRLTHERRFVWTQVAERRFGGRLLVRIERPDPLDLGDPHDDEENADQNQRTFLQGELDAGGLSEQPTQRQGDAGHAKKPLHGHLFAGRQGRDWPYTGQMNLTQLYQKVKSWDMLKTKNLPIGSGGLIFYFFMV